MRFYQHKCMSAGLLRFCWDFSKHRALRRGPDAILSTQVHIAEGLMIFYQFKCISPQACWDVLSARVHIAAGLLRFYYFIFENKSPAEKIHKLKTKISNNTPKTKVNSQPNSSKLDWSSRRHPGYAFNKEFNKETATFVGLFFWEFRWNHKKRNLNERNIEENRRKITGIA